MQFFPKTEKYVSLFVGGDNPDIVDKRNKLHKQIKANLMAAAASGKELEGTHVFGFFFLKHFHVPWFKAQLFHASFQYI